MNDDTSLMPRAACAIVALALSALTVDLMVVVPANSGRPLTAARLAATQHAPTTSSYASANLKVPTGRPPTPWLI